MALVSAVFLVLALLAFLNQRWAYFAFVIGGVLFFPARVGFHFHPNPCECVPTLRLALFSLTNYGHLVRFTIFFLMTTAQLRGRSLRTQILIATGAVMAMGIYVELAEGFTGNGHCRLRDLVPDLAGAMIGTVLLMCWKLVQKRRGAAAAVLIVLIATGCATQHVPATAPFQTVVSDQLYFGRNIPDGGTVSAADWAKFLAEVVTPRFPEGLTVWQTQGQWRNNKGIIESEEGFILHLLHPDDATSEQSVEEIMTAYKTRFRQEAVLRVRDSVRAQFW